MASAPLRPVRPRSAAACVIFLFYSSALPLMLYAELAAFPTTAAYIAPAWAADTTLERRLNPTRRTWSLPPRPLLTPQGRVPLQHFLGLHRSTVLFPGLRNRRAWPGGRPLATHHGLRRFLLPRSLRQGHERFLHRLFRWTLRGGSLWPEQRRIPYQRPHAIHPAVPRAPRPAPTPRGLHSTALHSTVWVDDAVFATKIPPHPLARYSLAPAPSAPLTPARPGAHSTGDTAWQPNSALA
jgi:hypothetical protein